MKTNNYEFTEWLDWTQLIGGKTMAWYLEDDCIKSVIF